MMNVYPPYIGAGVKIQHISDDWKELRVGMKVRWFNRNYVGTHFGGSLYSMVDPHLMLLLLRLLGRDYIVWDKAADIDFVKATKKPVTSSIKILDEDIKRIKENTQSGEKYLPEFVVEIRDTDDTLIATVKKTLYVRRKQRKSA